MGSINSAPVEESEDIWWTNGQRNIAEPITIAEKCVVKTASHIQNSSENDISLNQLSERYKDNLNEFKFEMERKHEKRREILAAKKKEFEDLRQELKNIKKENARLKSTAQPQEKTTTELQELREENNQLRLLLTSKQSGEALMDEMDKLLQENTILRDELKDKVQELEKTAILLDKNRELRISIADMQQELQSLNGVVVEFEMEREEYRAHVIALKDVINVSKKMLLIREAQLKELREKVESIEESLSGKEMNILSQDLRLEYERQLQSIRNLKTLYEERQRTDHKEKEELKGLLEETKKELQCEENKNKESEERISELEEINSQQYDQIKSLESNFGFSKAECRQYQAELTVINQLFSEILLGFNSSQEIDLDKLTKHLKDHHELLQNIVVNEISSEASSALPKVLLDLVNRANEEVEKKEDEKPEIEVINENGRKLETIIEESESQTPSDQINSPKEIVELLPKVWRVLIELLSHQKAPTNILTTEESTDENPCYKTVQTPKGPSLVLSVSQTFIRLKDLILEKKFLEKETGHLKQLNTHLETRLQDQEKRLGMVSSELNKTWHVVGKLQKQHQLLHTQEKILRYELSQKRKLLTTLREELEYSREKWQQAREKNSKTEKQWKQLRGEFASRRKTLVNDESNNSQESGYSDERCSSSDDEPGYETDIECVAKATKDGGKEESIEVGVTAKITQPESNEPKDQTKPESVNSSLSEQVLLCRADLENCTLLNVEPINLENITSEVLEVGSSKPYETKLNLTDQEPINHLLHKENYLTQTDNNTVLSKQSKTFENPTPEVRLEEGSVLIQETLTCPVSSVVAKEMEAILEDTENTTNESVIHSSEKTVLTHPKTESEEIDGEENLPSTSALEESKPMSLEKFLAAKEERLKRLEGQCEQLVRKVTNTTHKSLTISNKLDDLHEVYGNGSSPNSTSTTSTQLTEEDPSINAEAVDLSHMENQNQE